MTRLKDREPPTNAPSTLTPADKSISSKDKEARSQEAKSQEAKSQKAKSQKASQRSASQSAFAPHIRKAETKQNDGFRSDGSGKSTHDRKIATQREGQKEKVSLWRRFGRAVKRHPNVSQTLFFLILVSGTSVVLLSILFKGAWNTQRDNLAILSAILKMELNREDARVLEESPERVVTHNFRTLEPHVAADGWEWENRFGNTITYAKQDQRMIASCSPYSPLYMVCDLGEIPQ